MLHLSGNLNQWIVAGVGSGEDQRRRARESSANGEKDVEALLRELQATVHQSTQVLVELNTDSLRQTATI